MRNDISRTVLQPTIHTAEVNLGILSILSAGKAERCITMAALPSSADCASQLDTTAESTKLKVNQGPSKPTFRKDTSQRAADSLEGS